MVSSVMIIFILWWIGCFMMCALLMNTCIVDSGNIIKVGLYMCFWPIGFVVWCLKGNKDE